MGNKTYNALVVEEIGEKTFTRSIKEKCVDDLPAGDLLIRVCYSSLNYKDALSASGNKGVTRVFPHTPGIDASGIVEESDNDQFKPGDPVIVTSYDLGMNTPGGFGGYIRVPAAWAVKLPPGMTLKESMILGTAGFTAGMSVYKLIQHVSPDQGPILVTGATGGVGSIALSILSHLGYRVTGVTGKPEGGDFLALLGADRTISRETFTKGSERPILKAQWAGVIDTVGGTILAAAIKGTSPLGVVTCCGNVASPDLPITVFPFILRGVSLVGIDSQNCPMNFRKKVWKKLAGEWRFKHPDGFHREITLKALDHHIERILKGELKGRTIVHLDQ